MSKPVVALVGRPNVGKSTLFNRLAGERLSIVDDTPGTTRDRLYTDAEWNGIPFVVVDTGGIDPVTGASQEPLSIGSADFITEIKRQAEIAISDADAVLFMVDARSGVTPADVEVANILRRSQKMIDGNLEPPIFLVVNKAETDDLRANAAEFYELGLGEPYSISALHGLETGDLLDVLVESFASHADDEDDDSVKIAIVGKPNVGKSSLMNRLLGEERAIVSPIAGTTRDALDTRIDFQGIPIRLIDTAGIRKRGKIEPGVEKYSVLRSMRAIEKSDVSILVIDAETGITEQDTHIAGYILDEWKSAVVVVNKWDAVVKDNYTMQQYTERIYYELNFMSYVPCLFISAKTGQRVDQVLPLALKVQEQRITRLPTSAINRILQDAQDRHEASTKSGKHFKIYYGTQVRSDPPTFLIYVNEPKGVHFSYTRFLENSIRAEFPFTGTPIKLIYKSRRE